MVTEFKYGTMQNIRVIVKLCMQVIDYTGSVLMLLIDGITNMRITLDANDQRFCIKEYAQAAASGAGE